MSYVISYEKDGEKKTETKSSCYASIVRANELRAEGYKVAYRTKQETLVKGLSQGKITNKALIQNFISRAEKAINTKRKH